MLSILVLVCQSFACTRTNLAAKLAPLVSVTFTFQAVSAFGAHLTQGNAAGQFVVSSNGVTSSAVTDQGDGTYSFVHKGTLPSAPGSKLS
jgi:hypothetical protein